MLSRLSQTCLNSYLWKPVQFIPRIIGRVITRYPKTTFLTGSSIFLYMNYEYNAVDSIVLKDIKIPQEKLVDHLQPTSLFHRYLNYFIHFMRFIDLLIIFLPCLCLLPLLYFKRTGDYWRECFVKAVERAGVVWIKVFQYLSHRGDIIGPELAKKVERLREHAPMHSFEETAKIIKENYGKNYDEIFEDFEKEPIASGSVSQVYRAKYNGQKVAIKVRHNDVGKYIDRDTNLLFFFSSIASLISPRMELPITENVIKQVLKDQINFRQEMANLNHFKYNFGQRDYLKFPTPNAYLTRQSILVEDYSEGVTVSYFEKHNHKMNKLIARIGAATFFEMLMKHNFIHADCHGGNILVEVRSEHISQIRYWATELYHRMSNWFVGLMIDGKEEARLFKENAEEEIEIRKLEWINQQRVVVTIIDAGMVISLKPKDKENFVSFISSVLEGQGMQCAQKIYNLSMFKGQNITKNAFNSYMEELVELFSELNGKSVNALQGMDLAGKMLTIVRENKMKLEGEFATLLTNMMVLESIAKKIDPQISLLKCAIPYLKYANE